MLLNKFDTDVDLSVLVEIAHQYCRDDFSRKTVQNLEHQKLVKFVIDKKYGEFLTFLKGFVQFTKFDAKLNTLVNSNRISIEEDEFGVKFYFNTNKDYKTGTEVREINYLYAILENYMYGAPSSISNDYLINTNYNEFHLEFYPNWLPGY